MIEDIIDRYKNEIGKRNKLSEVGCFRSLLTALRGTAGVVAKEYHAKSYVRFSIRDKNLRSLKTNGRCELSDIVLIAFSSTKKHPVKMTFLQAKICKKHIFHNSRKRYKYSVDHTQWDLLHNRPSFVATGKIKNIVPSTILSNAALPSIGSYGFFIPSESSTCADFTYFSAGRLRPIKVIQKKTGRVLYSNKTNKKMIRNGNECTYACCLSVFLEEFFLGRIGSPISNVDDNNFVSALVNSIEQDKISKNERETLNKLREALKVDRRQSAKIKMRFAIVDTSNYS